MKRIIIALLIAGCSDREPVTKSETVAPAPMREVVAKPPDRKFKVGDCILSTAKHEDWEPNIPRRIGKIGARNYYAPSADEDIDYSFETLSFHSIEDGSFIRVPCPQVLLVSPSPSDEP